MKTIKTIENVEEKRKPIHSKIPGIKSVGEILQEDFKELFKKKYSNDRSNKNS